MIEVCAKANVRSIQFDGLRLEFGEPVTAIIGGPLPANEPTTPTEAALSEKHDEQNQDALLAEEVRTKEEQIRHMLIEDPALAEQLICEGDLELTDEGDDDGE